MTINKDKILGVILAGGLSRRMKGENKFFKKINGNTLIQFVINNALRQVSNLVINANIDKSKFNKFKLDVVKDSIKGFKGPLAGILSAINYGKKKNFKWIVTLPCDAPFFPFNLVSKLLERTKKNKYKIVIAKSNKRIHPVFGIWNVSLKDSLTKTLINENERKIDLFIKKHSYSVVNFNYKRIDPFFNINNYDDLKKANKFLNLLENHIKPHKYKI